MAIVVRDLAGGREIPMAGGQKARLFNITGDTAYPAGGTPVTPGLFGMTSLLAITGGCSAGRVLSFDPTNSKLPVFISGGAGAVLAENAVADISASNWNVLVVGA